MFEPPRLTEVQGVPMLSLDFRHKNAQEVADYILVCKPIIAKCPEGSVRFLVNVTGMNFGMRTVRDFTLFSKFNNPFAQATAIIGMTPQMQVLYNAALALAGRDKSRVRTVNTEAEGIAWLASFQEPVEAATPS